MFKKKYKAVVYLLCIIFSISTSYATHLRGGEVTLKRLPGNALSFEITVTTYTDKVGGIGANNAQNEVPIRIFNNGVLVATFNIRRGPRRDIRADTEINVYKGEYTFRAPGTYQIGCDIPNRNDNVVNMFDSDDTSFYIETFAVINTELGLNGTPILLNPAADFTAIRGQRYVHNPNAFDAEGDSLAYRLIKPRFIRRDCRTCLPEVVRDYKDPNTIPAGGRNEDNSRDAIFEMDSLTGDLVWDAPLGLGQYNVAFQVLEYRNGVLISVTVRDMQIIVKDGNNKRPRIDFPGDTCIVAGTNFNKLITAKDPDNNPVTITMTGPIFEKPDGPSGAIPPQIPAPWATFKMNTTRPSVGEITWQTSCDHIRTKPYEILIKAEDSPSMASDSRLTDVKIWKIKVIPPPITGLTAKARGAGAIELLWSRFACLADNAVIEVYRKIGCSDFSPSSCQLGLPENSGYRLITTLPIDAVTYVDKGLDNNLLYSYRLVIRYTEDEGSTLGVASREVCLSIPVQMPVITNVSIENSSKTNGEILVKWTRPLGFLPDGATGPYQFKLVRATGAGNFVEITTKITNDPFATTDTTYRDSGFNTEDIGYRYQIEFYYTQNGSLRLLDATLPASTVRLSASSASRAVNLSWTANVPWSNENQEHEIYRQAPNGTFNIIAKIPVTNAASFTYIDTGQDRFTEDGNQSLTLSVDETYCYRIKTVGKYLSLNLVPDKLENFSQRACASPKDDIKPCPPVLSVDPLNCEQLKTINCDNIKFENNLTWVTGQGAGCDTTFRGYNIYYTRYENEPFTKIGNVGSGLLKKFTHANMSSFAGCYYITAVNRFDNESEPSNRVCKDNCPDFLQFPNVITPNGDGKNDDFQPMWCGLFIKNIKYTVVNRQGIEVYKSVNTEPLIKWNGTNTAGIQLPAGIYYYQAEVTFDRLAKTTPKQVVKGWVEIIR